MFVAAAASVTADVSESAELLESHDKALLESVFRGLKASFSVAGSSPAFVSSTVGDSEVGVGTEDAAPAVPSWPVALSVATISSLDNALRNPAPNLPVAEAAPDNARLTARRGLETSVPEGAAVLLFAVFSETPAAATSTVSTVALAVPEPTPLHIVAPNSVGTLNSGAEGGAVIPQLLSMSFIALGGAELVLFAAF